MTTGRLKMVGTVANLEMLELQRLRAKVERLMSALDEALETESSDSFDSFSPAVDISENKDLVCVWVELPGVPKDSVELTVSAKEVLIEGEKKHSENTEKAISHFCCERMYGRFRRRILLRWAVNIKEVHAELKEGVLMIRLPKLIDRRGKSVRVDVIEEELEKE